jgi:hypothetical protein
LVQKEKKEKKRKEGILTSPILPHQGSPYTKTTGHKDLHAYSQPCTLVDAIIAAIGVCFVLRLEETQEVFSNTTIYSYGSPGWHRQHRKIIETKEIQIEVTNADGDMKIIMKEKL